MSLKDWFVNASIGAAYNETPAAGAAMAASGFYKNDEGNWRLDPDRLGLDEMRKGLAGLGTVGLTAYSIPWLLPYFAPGTAGGNFIGTLAAGEAVRLGANMLYNNLTDSETGDYMKDAFNEIGGNNISNPIVKGIAEGVFSATDPAYWTGAPILTRAFGGIKSLANKVADAVTTPIKEGMAEAFTKASPKYSFKYNPKTGKFDVSLDESPMDISETAPTKLVRVNRGDTKGLSFQPSRKALPQFSPMSNEDHMLIYQALQNSGYAPEGTNININNTADGLTIEGDGLNLAIATLDIPTFMLNIRTNGTIDIPTSKVNYGSVINLPSTLSTESPIILKGFNNHLQGGDAVLMFKEYGGDYPVRLYRILPSNQEALTSSVPEPGRENYVGMWFTTDVEKPAWYAHQARQGKGKTASDPLDLQYVDIPASKLEQYKASNIITEPIDYERFEDYLIPLDYPRLTVSVPEGKLMQVSQWLRENELPLSPLMSELMKYVPEARERYGLVGNTDITDEEIALALYKQAVELGEGTAATYPSGEPLLLFRGDTRDYTLLKPSPSPTSIISRRGDMDNSLGTLFLGEFPGTYRDRLDAVGASRYLNGLYKDVSGNWTWRASGTAPTERMVRNDPGYRMFFEPGKGWKGKTLGFIKDKSTSEAPNNLNAFVVLTPAVRDATREIAVISDDLLLLNAGNKSDSGIASYLGTNYTVDPDTYHLIKIDTGEDLGEVALGKSERERAALADHYEELLKDSETNLQGLLKSNPKSPLRNEHEHYTYFALPNFNIGGAKHILPYDLRRPRLWASSNIYAYTDPFGKEIIPTPYTGELSDFEEVTRMVLQNVLLDYFQNPLKIEQIKNTMGWGDTEIKELLNELLRSLGTLARTEVKGLDEGFNYYAEHSGQVGPGSNGQAEHIITYNKDRTPTYEDIVENAIHELGGHGKTLGISPERYGENGPSDVFKKLFPRIAELMEKNKQIADEILVLNDATQELINSSVDSPELRHFNYVNTDLEKYARGYTGQLMERLDPEYKTSNIKLLERYFTPESVEAFKNRLLQLGIIVGTGSSLFLNDDNEQESYKQGGRLKLIPKAKSGIHIKKKNRGKFTEYCGGKVTDKCILKAKHSSNPTLRKRATFALNARKWNKKK